MLDVVQVVGGALLVLLVFVDALMTTVTVSAGAGPLTSRVLAVCWRGLRRFHRPDAERSLLTYGGTALLMTTIVTWVTMLWAGWTLTFLGSDDIVSATTRQPADLSDVVYFSGLTAVTLGTGDFVAATSSWRVVSVVASFSGLFLVTLAITYLISVVSAVVGRRALAIQIYALGATPQDIVVRGWNGEGFSNMFEQQLVNLTEHVVTVAEQHLAYPVLHYFRASQRSLAAPCAVALLDDALLLLDSAVAPAGHADPSAVQPLRFAVDRYVTTAGRISATPEVETPRPPTTHRLQEAGVPTVPETAFRAALVRTADRRTQLHELVVSAGWRWH